MSILVDVVVNGSVKPLFSIAFLIEKAKSPLMIVVLTDLVFLKYKDNTNNAGLLNPATLIAVLDDFF